MSLASSHLRLAELARSEGPGGVAIAPEERVSATKTERLARIYRGEEGGVRRAAVQAASMGARSSPRDQPRRPERVGLSVMTLRVRRRGAPVRPRTFNMTLHVAPRSYTRALELIHELIAGRENH